MSKPPTAQILAAALISLFAANGAMAQTCIRKSGAPTTYRLETMAVDDIKFAGAAALDITPNGDTLVLRRPPSLAALPEQVVVSSTGAETVPGNAFGTGHVLIDRLYANGFQSGRHTSGALADPVTRVTPVMQNGKGNGLAFAMFCQSSGAELVRHVTSASGEFTMAQYRTEGGHSRLVRCAEGASQTLFEATEVLDLVGVTDKGDAVGEARIGVERRPWRINLKGERSAPFGEQLADVQLVSVAADGTLLARQFTGVKIEGLLNKDGKTRTIDFFGEPGWSLMGGLIGACGEVFGVAMKTSYEAFQALDAAEQERIRTYTDLVNDWDSRRQTTSFVWSAKSGARPLAEIVEGDEAFGAIEIAAINSSGIAVGVAFDDKQRGHAIRLVPNR
jgi:hypothetical protein